MAVTPVSEGRRSRLSDARKNLPDGPGVYLFKDAAGGVIYVGKAKSLKKRVASHFSNPVTRGQFEMVDAIESVDVVSVGTEAEALLAEQNFIRQYKPRFNIRLRDDKSYPFIAISMDEEFPRVYFTRERHRRGRLYFGPYSSAKRVRSTLGTLGKLFPYRSCNGTTPGRRSGSPCLDYYIKRCSAPCVPDLEDRDGYRESIDAVVAFLQGRYAEVERGLDQRMREAAEVHEFEQAAIERNRLQAVRSLLERQRVANASVGTVDAVGVAMSGTDANAQVFQVRDGVLSDRQSFYLANEGERGEAEVLEEFLVQYYGQAGAVPPQVVVAHELSPAVAEALSEQRGARVEVRVPERGDKRRILELATRNALLALDTEKLKSERRREQRVEALDGLQRALDLEALPVRIECFDISNLMGTHTTASMVVFEGGAPKKSDYRRFNVRGAAGIGVPDDFASMEEVLSRRMEQFERQQDLSPHDPKRNESFASLPALVVIDGGPGQLGAGVRALQGFLDRGVKVVSLAKRIEEVFVPGVPAPLVLGHDTPELQLLQRVRDEAHRFAVTHHRVRRDAAMTESVLDGLPGIGATRKRALLKHFGSPEAVLAASSEELETVPGVPPKIAREVFAHLRTQR